MEFIGDFFWFCVKAAFWYWVISIVLAVIFKRAENKAEQKNEMMKKSGGRMTVPQIFIGDFHVGGCDDLYALEAAGKLDELLA